MPWSGPRTRGIYAEDLRPHQQLGSQVPGHRPVLRAARRRLAAEPAGRGRLGSRHWPCTRLDGGEMARRCKAKIDPLAARTCFETTVERAGKKPSVGGFGGIPADTAEESGLRQAASSPGNRLKGVNHSVP
jgi:hypothetical protein